MSQHVGMGRDGQQHQRPSRLRRLGRLRGHGGTPEASVPALPAASDVLKVLPMTGAVGAEFQDLPLKNLKSHNMFKADPKRTRELGSSNLIRQVDCFLWTN